MGSVALPTTGLDYVDANVVIYAVEKHPRYSPLLRPLWNAVTTGQARVVAIPRCGSGIIRLTESGSSF